MSCVVSSEVEDIMSEETVTDAGEKGTGPTEDTSVSTVSSASLSLSGFALMLTKV